MSNILILAGTLMKVADVSNKNKIKSILCSEWLNIKINGSYII